MSKKSLNIFISTSGTTAILASQLKRQLLSKGHKVSLYAEESVFRKEIEQSDKVIVLLSSGYFESQDTLNEYHAAQGKIFPVMVEQVDHPQLPNAQHCDVTTLFAENHLKEVVNKIVDEFEQFLYLDSLPAIRSLDPQPSKPFALPNLFFKDGKQMKKDEDE